MPEQIISTEDPRLQNNDILDPRTLSRLTNYGFDKMKHFRKSRLLLLKQYITRMYGPEDQLSNRSTPINMIYQAATTLVPNLVFRNPKCQIGTKYLSFRQYANLGAEATNHLVDEIRLRDTLRKVITDAIFMAGFMKEGLGVSGQTLDLDGFLHDVGQPYADRVDPDDMVLDPIAREWEEQRFMGNRFTIELSALQESGLYSQEALEQLTSRYEQWYLQNSAEALSGNRQQIESGQLIKSVDLVELYIPSEGVIVTLPWLPTNEVATDFLRIVDYAGPERGPYHMLGFAFVPDNILPVAPAYVWYDLHTLTNRIARKASRQAERQKSILAYESSAWQDAQEVADADDGETVRVDNVQAIKEVAYGGTAEDCYRYIDWAKAQFSEMAMNIDMLSGTSTGEPTATQAQMVQANTDVRLADMREIVYRFTQDAMEQLFFFLHTDPLIEMPMVKRVKGGEEEQIVYSPEMREGDFIDYFLKVKPMSMARPDPNANTRRLIEFCSNVIPALAQAFQILGPAFNIEAAINIVGQQMDIDELDEIINSDQLQQMLNQNQMAILQGLSQQGQGDAGAKGLSPNANPMGMIQSGITPQVEQNQGFQMNAPQPAGAA